MQELSDILRDVIDLHIHPGPDRLARVADAIEITQLAKNAGMRALLFKSHEFMNAELTNLVERVVPGIRVFGGVVLDNPVGGINPRVVDITIGHGGKCVWMPTIDSAANDLAAEVFRKKGKQETVLMKSLEQRRGDNKKRLKVIGTNGELLPEVKEILGLIAEADIIVATSHMSSEERLPFVKEAKKNGVKKIVVTHSNSNIVFVPIEEQKELVRNGATMEYSYAPLVSFLEGEEPEEVANMIQTIGAQNIVLSTDSGASWGYKYGYAACHPTEAMAAFIIAMRNRGVTKQEIDTMVKENPSKLLDL